MTFLKQSDDFIVKGNLKGGNGNGKFRYVPNCGPENAITMAARIELDPGADIAFHLHDEDEEIYAIISGNGIYLADDGSEHDAASGDIFVTHKGMRHGIKNTGTEPLVFFAMVAQK